MNAHCEGATGNVLVDALPSRERSKLTFVEVCVSAGQVLCEHDQEVMWAYFPTTCVVSSRRKTTKKQDQGMRALWDSRKFTAAELAKQCGISVPTFFRRMRPKA
jgi:hypothetical protein